MSLAEGVPLAGCRHDVLGHALRPLASCGLAECAAG